MSHRTSNHTSFLSPWLAIAIAIALIVTGGALYGSYSQRWGQPANLVAMGQAVEQMPTQVGDWIMIDKAPMEKSALEMLECAGYVNRKYQHRDSGQIVNLAIIVGPPGPIAVHTPEICFSSRAYEQQSNRERTILKSARGDNHSFWRLGFDTKNVLANKLRVYYAWSLGPEWVASESPRYEFAANPALYKLQLSAEIPPGELGDTEDPGREFLQALIDSNWHLGPPHESTKKS
jgi:hypothetical protein